MQELAMLAKPFLVAVTMIWSAASAMSQEFPVRPITLVVPFAAGGPTDVVARIVSAKASELLKVSIIIDNRGGAGGVIGSRAVQIAPPDGYTLLLGTASTHAINPQLMRAAPYDPTADFKPIAIIGSAPIVMLVSNTNPAKSLQELTTELRRERKSNNYGTAGAGTITHLTSELFKKRAQVDAEHVPYRGQAPALTDLLAGRLSFVMDSSSSVTPHIQSGAVRALAIASEVRSAALPNIPTMREAGLPDFVASTWNVLFAPAGTPPSIVNRLSSVIRTALADPVVGTKLRDLGVELDVSTPESTMSFVRSQVDFWRPIAIDSGVKLD